MAGLERMNVGVVGSGGRGAAFREALEATGARIHAVCDVDEDALDRSRKELGAAEKYFDYDEMIARSDLDAVVVATPMPYHARQAVRALMHDLHVLSEVPAAISVQECVDIVQAAEKSRGLYMMAENSVYTPVNVLIGVLVRRGLFGEPYYAEGEYLHELKALNETTRWRRRWQTGIDGITYGTHSLGPILQWMPEDRVVRVCCEGSGTHHEDPRGDPYHQDTAVMLCKTARDALIKVRVDMVSDRPHAMANYQLQGTDGVYESGRGGPDETGRIWLRSLSREVRWHSLGALTGPDSLAERYLPEPWLNPSAAAQHAGHGGGDYFQVFDFVQAVTTGTPCRVGVHEAMDMTLPGLISQQSIAQDGAWLAVPNSRNWPDGSTHEPLQMVFPEDLLASPVPTQPPAGYLLRCYDESLQDAWLSLVKKAGFDGWNRTRLAGLQRTILPDGCFLLLHRASGEVVATAMARHRPTELHPGGGEVDLVAVDPGHSGKGLDQPVCGAAVARLIRAGYHRIYLTTDDSRLPAIRGFLKLGWEPLLHNENMERRWEALLTELGWKARPGRRR